MIFLDVKNITPDKDEDKRVKDKKESKKLDTPQNEQKVDGDARVEIQLLLHPAIICILLIKIKLGFKT